MSVSETFAAALRERTSPLRLALLRRERDPCGERAPHRPRPRPLPPGDEETAVGVGIRARERPQELGAARADEPGEAEDLSATERQGDVLQHPRDAEALDPERLLLHDPAPLRRRLHDHVPEHGRDETLLRPVLDRFRRDELAVAHHRHAVAQAEYLVEVVGDVDGCDALVAQPANRLVEALALGRAERGRGLIHDQDAVVGGERPHDLEQPLIRHRQRRGPHVRVDREAEPLRQFPECCARAGAGDEHSAPPRPPEEHVGGC